MPRARGFTLVELLVVVAILAVMVGFLMPALTGARRAALTTRCLANIKNMEMAHTLYMNDWRGAVINVGLSHGGAHGNAKVAWINTLQRYYADELLRRSPVDDSPHWPADEGGRGEPLPGTADLFRRTSYGVNNFTTPLGAAGYRFERISDFKRPGGIVHFLIMAYEGEYAGADHTHVELWYLHLAPAATPRRAATQVQTDAHGGPPESWDSVSNYGFLDGHAETLSFREVYDSPQVNKFVPDVIRDVASR